MRRLALLVLILLPARVWANGPTRVRGAGNNSASSATVAVTLSAAPATGNTVICAVTAFNNGTLRTLNSIKDGNNNALTISASSPSTTFDSTAGSSWIAYTTSAPSNATATYTATYSGTNASADMWCTEFSWSGGGTISVDTDQAGSTTGGGLTNGTIFPAAINTLLYGLSSCSSSVTDTGTWTQEGTNLDGNAAAYVLNRGLLGKKLDWTLGCNGDIIMLSIKQVILNSAPVTTDFVQGGGISTLSDQSISAGGTLKVRLQNASISGNALVLGCGWSTTNTPTITISDDKSNTWVTSGPNTTDTTNHIKVQIYYALNIASGTTVINFSPSTATNKVGCSYAEYQNIATSAASDGSNAAFNASTGTAVAPGSFTPGTNNDKIIQFAMSTKAIAYGSGSTSVNSTGGWTSQSGFTLIDADAYDGHAMQYEIQSTAAAINPTLTQTISNGWATAAIALKQATSGGTFSGVHVDRVQHVNTYGETDPVVAFQMPGSGNTIILAYVSGGGVSGLVASSISDTEGNTYTQVGSTTTNSSNVQFWKAVNVTPNDLLVVRIVTTGSTGAGNGATVWAASISGADSSNPIDTSFGTSGLASGTGNDTTSGAGNLSLFSATPGNQNEVALVATGIDQDSTTGVGGPTGAQFVATTWSGITSPAHSDENNFFGVFYNGSSTASQSWSLTHDQSVGIGVGKWAAAGVSIKAPGTSVSPVNKRKKLDRICGAGLL